MKPINALAMLATLALAQSAHAVTIDTFEVGDSANYSDVYGNAAVVGPTGLMTTHSLQFDSPNPTTECFNDICYDQVEYGPANRIGANLITFDLDLSDMDQNRFTILSDTPTVRNLSFDSSGSVSVFGGGISLIGGPKTFDKNVLQQVEILVDVPADLYQVILNGVVISSGSYDADPSGLRAVRFSYRTDIGTGPNSAVRLDNVNISAVASVPIPAAVWLFGSALAGVGALRRHRGR